MTFKYDWDSYPKVKEFLIKIYNNTLNSLKLYNYNEYYAKEFLSDIEDYIYYFRISNYDIDRIINKLDNIDRIIFLNLGNKLGSLPVITIGNRILLNTNIDKDKRLTSKERRRLYLYRSLSHSLLSFRNEKTKEFSKIFNEYLPTNAKETELLVDNGWLLLEDTLSQEIAEKITYKMINKDRPGLRPGLENETFPIDGNIVSSNLEMNRMFQPILILFGMTIDNIGNMYNITPEVISNDFIKIAISKEFSDLVISEYISKDNIIELYQLLYLMGLLINEQYSIYDINFISKLNLTNEEIKEIYSSIYKLCTGLTSFENKEYESIAIPKKEYPILTKKRIINFLNNYKI